jgi:GNAT superfamily N-acetyltransferase
MSTIAKKFPESDTYVAKDGDTIYGWCIILETPSGAVYPQFYVPKHYRGYGIARRLFERVLRDYDVINVLNHDNTSGSFYKHFQKQNPNRIRIISLTITNQNMELTI